MPFEGRIMHHLHHPIRVITRNIVERPTIASMRRLARRRKYFNQLWRKNSHSACAPGFGWRASSGRSR